jgi:hypothetical protein
MDRAECVGTRQRVGGLLAVKRVVGMAMSFDNKKAAENWAAVVESFWGGGGRSALSGERFAARQTMRERAFDQTPAQSEIRAVLGQRPDRMQVIGQDHSGFDGERMTRSHLAKRGLQQADVLGQKPEPTFGQIDGEEMVATGYEIVR